VKKILVVVVVVALVLSGFLIGASFYIGGKIAEQLPDELRKAQALGIPLTVKEAHRGVFTSRYVIATTIPFAKSGTRGPLLVPVEMTSNIIHGPIPFMGGSLVPHMFVGDATFALAADADPAVREAFEKLPELSKSVIHVQGDFDNTGDVTITVPAFSKDLPQKNGTTLHVDWKGFTARAKRGTDTVVTGTFEAPGITLATGPDAVALSGFSGTFATKPIEGLPLLSTGDVHYALKLFDVKMPSEGTAFSVSDITADGHLAARGSLVDYDLVLKGTRHAPGSQDIPASLGITLRSLDAKTLNDLLDLMQKARFHPDQEPSEEEIMRMAAGLLPHSPSVALNISAMEGTPDGPVTLKAEAKTDHMDTLPLSWELARTQLRANASLDASEKSLRMLACLITRALAPGMTDAQCQAVLTQRINELTAQGHLIHTDGKLTSEAVWNGQALLINGKPLQ